MRAAIDSPERLLAIREAPAGTRSTGDFVADLISVYGSCTGQHRVVA
jgi:hypothetical protein